jgi:hypothetical protein
MCYIHKLIYILFLGLFACSLWAQDTRYRVEVLVLTHLKSVEPAAEADEIRDYSSALDLPARQMRQVSPSSKIRRAIRPLPPRQYRIRTKSFTTKK